MNHSSQINRLAWAVACVLLPQGVYALPNNNTLTQATPITTLPFSQQQDTRNATDEAQQAAYTCVGDRYQGSVWYQYTATQAGVLLVDTFGSDYDTVLAIWTGDAHPLTQQACNDDSGTVPQSLAFAEVEAGTRYWISVNSLKAAGGELSLQARLVSGLDNDNIAQAIPITPNAQQAFSREQITENASSETQEVISRCGGGAASVWYRYTPSESQQVVFTTTGSNYDTVLSLWTGQAHPLTEVACNESHSSVLTSSVTARLTAGTSYWIRASGVDDETGLLRLNLHPIPTNDRLEDAQALTGNLPLHHSQFTYGATGQDAVSCAESAGADVWLSYRPQDEGLIKISTEHSDYNTVLTVWAQDANSQRLELACNDDARLLSFGELTSQVTVSARPNEIYYLQVSGYDGEMGGLQLHIEAADLDFTIQQQPQNTRITSGAEATLEVTIVPTNETQAARQPVTYQWYAGETGDTRRPVGTNSEVLQLKNVTESGYYWVKIRNPSGTLSSHAALVQVDEQAVVDKNNGLSVDSELNPLDTKAHLFGTLSRKADQLPTNLVNQREAVTIDFVIDVDPAHQGQAAKLVLVGAYQGSAFNGIFALHGSEWQVWDGTLLGLGQMQEMAALPAQITLPIFDGQLTDLVGEFTFFIGYQLADNTLVYGSEPLNFTVTP
ncbi:hypothetical protein [Thioflexithrix psekupsensis]|uniref:Immunoglobulin domain-containing protein n=1 Tax=Thioflexithrix psekupsensis TaxID=1570016 RepID=A0A251X8C4_9GAMM|nr:hypothetical protein [Thioflexithrix psekupsensis]OUD14318.1 hypothetical protein TPSD3_08330 [Thioflexithrix psekupsensis]